MAIRDITGNSKVKDILLKIIKEEKHGKPYIFYGDENLGKTFAAVQFGKALNCLTPKSDADACDTCANCKLIDKIFFDLDEDGFQKNPHPDTLYINTLRAEIRIDTIKDKLIEINTYRAIKLKKKILIVQDAEKMNVGASNSILKELEEPGEKVVIILVVNDIGKILPTIISRCTKIDFIKASEAEIEKGLLKFKLEWTEERIKEAVKFCDGRIGDAVNFEEKKENIQKAIGLFIALAKTGDNVEAIFGEINNLEAIKKEAKEKKPAKTEETTENGEKIKENTEKEKSWRMILLDIMVSLAYIYKDMLLENSGKTPILALKYGIKTASLKTHTARNIVNIMKLIENAQRELMANANTNLLFSNLFFAIRKEVKK
ncbi:MAG: hypothetical protein WCJ46_00265 [bacterium]